MCRRDFRAGFRVGLGIGAGIAAWAFPLATYFGARLAGRHHLSITTEENR